MLILQVDIGLLLGVTAYEASSNISLLDIPLEIIEKYKVLTKGNRVFHVPSDKSCNTQLNRMAVACGIQKEFTFHCSRHNINSSQRSIGMLDFATWAIANDLETSEV